MKRIFVEDESGAVQADIAISRGKVAGIIEHARIFDAREADNNSGSRPDESDDDSADILLDSGTDSVGRELRQLIRDLNVDEQASLVALAWIGRGTYSAAEWDQALSHARTVHNGRTAEYLLGLPLLSDYLESGMTEIDNAAAAKSARQFG